MRVALLTREYPPEVYGGAGVHVDELSRALDALPDVDVAVHCFGGPRRSPLVAATYEPWDALRVPGRPWAAALETLSVDLAMAAGAEGADVVHSHTWYADLGGHLAGLVHDVPHVATVHSLEPHRPWKAEQLGGGYRVSSWAERTALEAADAVIAVSEGTRADVLDVYPGVAPNRVHVVHNGIDPERYRVVDHVGACVDAGVDPDAPYVMFVGRMTRQKGIDALLRAAPSIDAPVVVCAGAPDTPELALELRALAASAPNVVWLEGMLDDDRKIQLLSGATVFVCPSVYEPFGLINLEAMACETAVVATAVGGIPEVVDPGVTGVLVEPGDGVHERLAAEVTALLGDPARAVAMGRAGRERVVDRFSWTAIAEQTVDIYRIAAAIH